jgi:hypothetical protein
VALGAAYAIRTNADAAKKFELLAAFANELANRKLPIPERPLIVNCDSWDVLTQSYEDFAGRARKVFKERLANYRLNREVEAEKLGLEKTPRKHFWDPYIWLACHQIHRWSAGRIADAIAEGDKKRRAVEQQIRDLANEIDLTLRPKDYYKREVSAEEINAVLKRAKAIIARTASSSGVFPSDLRKYLPPVLRGRPA